MSATLDLNDALCRIRLEGAIDIGCAAELKTLLVQALHSCGFEGEELRTQLEATEFFKCSPELIEEILRAKGNGDGGP